MDELRDEGKRQETLRTFREEGVTCVMIKNIPIKLPPIVMLNLLFANDVV